MNTAQIQYKEYKEIEKAAFAILPAKEIAFNCEITEDGYMNISEKNCPSKAHINLKKTSNWQAFRNRDDERIVVITYTYEERTHEIYFMVYDDNKIHFMCDRVELPDYKAIAARVRQRQQERAMKREHKK